MKNVVVKILIAVVALASVMIPFDISEAYTGYVKVDGYYYYFNSKGNKRTGLQTINGKPYYFYKKSGRGASKGWIEHSDGTKRFSYGNGKLAVGHVKIGKYNYYFDKKGIMKKSLQMINGKPYYFYKQNGHAAPKGWIKHSNGNKRYSFGKGRLATGYVNIGKSKYYFDSKGIYIPKQFLENVTELSGDEINYGDKTYKMYCQYSRKFKGYNGYLASHGCTITTLTSVLRAYVPECSEWTPYETITIAEKKVVGSKAFKKNYSKSLPEQMPITFNCITKILDKYEVDHEYVYKFSSDKAIKKDIINHLKSGKPIIFVISQLNRQTNIKTDKWTGSFHTMLMIGVDDNNRILIGNPAGTQRFHIVSLDEMINYMWSCSKTPNEIYWRSKARCGGYIKIME